MVAVVETLQQLIDRTDARLIAAELLGQGKRSGSSVRYPAIWAGGDNPTRIAVYEHGFHDFRDDSGGNVVQLISLILNLSYADAADWLRTRMSSGQVITAASSPHTTDTAIGEPPPAAWQWTATRAVEAAEHYLWSDRPDAQRVLAYLHQRRGLSDDTIHQFHLGYNPGWRKLAYSIDGKSIRLAPGITIPYFDGGALWAVRVRCRVGNLAEAFGNAPDRQRDGTALAKYLNLSGSKVNGPIFNGDALHDGSDVLVVEGEFDAMLAQQQLGDSVTVVTLGPASSRLIKRGRDRLQTAGHLYLALDNDQAGRQAAERLVKALPLKPELLALPKGKDITEFAVEQGGDLVNWWARRDGFDPAPDAPLTLWQYAPYMIYCPEYALIQLHVRQVGIADDFTAAQLAAQAQVSKDTAQRWITKAERRELVSERAAELKTIKASEPDSIVCKNAARHYCLTPQRGEADLRRALPDYVQELLAASEPAEIYCEEAAEAGLDADTAAQLETTTAEITRTLAALEISAWVERMAAREARELGRRAELDTTSFAPELLPRSVRELRTRLIEALHATDSARNWRHSEFMWIAGVKRGSVAALIAKSRLVPAATSTYLDVPLTGRDLRGAVKTACRRHHGAPVAWLNADGEVICPFSYAVPAAAAGVRLNCGKTYSVRATGAEPVVVEANPTVPAAEAAKPEAAEQRQQRRVQGQLLPRLRGCLLARGWEYLPGPYGGWVRAGEVQPNTFAGLVAALLRDYTWARAQQADGLIQFAETLGAEVQTLR